LGVTGNSSLEQWVGAKKVIKSGENIKISLAKGRRLIVKMPPPAAAQREVVEDFLIAPSNAVTGPRVAPLRSSDADQGAPSKAD
jgi:hypothetical protein